MYILLMQNIHTMAIYNLGKKINRPDALYMPGCELPTTTKIENVKAITKALEDLQ